MGRKSCPEALFGRDYTFQGFIFLADLSVNGENAYFKMDYSKLPF